MSTNDRASTSLTANPPAGADIRLLIFGLPPQCSRQEVRGLLHHCGMRLGSVPLQWEIDLTVGSGEVQEVIATIHHLPDRMIASRLADGLRRHRYHGRALQGWVPVMAWS